MTTTQYRNMLSGPVKRSERKLIQARTNFQEPPAARKQMRVLEVIKMLCEKPMTLQEMADKLDISDRTIRRYCAMIVDIGCALEADEQNRYQIDNCPLCKKDL